MSSFLVDDAQVAARGRSTTLTAMRWWGQFDRWFRNEQAVHAARVVLICTASGFLLSVAFGWAIHGALLQAGETGAALVAGATTGGALHERSKRRRHEQPT